ncbi:PREDICTED: uncharacterized protein LOC108966009 [Bactrocera latifrons]|uniref:uncharacterized protein LOC108966009 n=1 Tax=Bactrocera latifrons TaxID=174628 RepID=UPI0008DCA83B|nr:PREDICTED: uncharacterized protein LOC108966009 [Bactrocera latifrons]
MFIIKLNTVIINVLTCFVCNVPRSVATGSRILGLFATYSKSHMLLHCTVAEQLARVGHDVTVIGIIENVYPNVAYKYIHLQLPDGGIIDDKTLNSLINTRHSFVKSLFVTTAEYLRMANETLWQPKMHGLGDAFSMSNCGFVGSATGIANQRFCW